MELAPLWQWLGAGTIRAPFDPVEILCITLGLRYRWRFSVVRPNRKTRRWPLLWVPLLLVCGYFFFSWRYDQEVAGLLQQVLREHDPSGGTHSIVVKEVSFTEPFLLSNFRHGSAWVELDGKAKPLEFSATGNGLWKRDTVELSPWQLATAYGLPADESTVDRPGSPASAPDPGAMSDSGFDHLSQKSSVTISEGGVEAHLGREVKTVRPKLSLTAQLDLLGSQFPTMKLRVHLSPDGKVKMVDIVKSTGSEEVDRAVTAAVYQWQFAPRKGKSNSPDIVSFEIDWR